jgi:hypothetical protein
MIKHERDYPYSLKNALHNNRFENIVDSNIFSAYISDELPVPKIDDPRKTQSSPTGVPRHPGYIRTARINQIFSYIGYIKRVRKSEFREYLPILFSELDRFFHVFVDIIFFPDIIISEDIYAEQQMGFQHFIDMFRNRKEQSIDWIENVWRNQKAYLENIEGILKSLKRRGKVFDFRKDSMYREIVAACEGISQDGTLKTPCHTDIHFVANCCLKAARDRKPKTIWSADRDVSKILYEIYKHRHLVRNFPQIYLRAGYFPKNYRQLFP